MNKAKINELKYRAKSAFGVSQFQLDRKEKEKKNFSTTENILRLTTGNRSKINNFKNPKNLPRSLVLSRIVKAKNNSVDNKKNDNNLSCPLGSIDNGYSIDDYHPFILSANSKNIININNKLINDLNEQINILNERKKAKKFSYKQTVNLQKLNDYIIYEYTKNKMEFNKMNNKKTTTSFRLPIQYRRMGNHSKKEDLIPISILPKINLEDILILHNSNARNTMTKNKVHNYYLKKNVKYKKSQLNPFVNKGYSDEIALKYINIF